MSFVKVACNQCGYNLTGVAIGGICPECGAGVDQSLYSAGRADTNGKAITSMVLGICSLVFMLCCGIGALLGIIGLIFGIIALNETKTGNYSDGSRSMALAGLWCSGITLALTLGYFLLMFAT